MNLAKKIIVVAATVFGIITTLRNFYDQDINAGIGWFLATCWQSWYCYEVFYDDSEEE